jgi:hypothetical protein
MIPIAFGMFRLIAHHDSTITIFIDSLKNLALVPFDVRPSRAILLDVMVV